MSTGMKATQALAGRVIVVTRAREQASSFAALLEDAGAEVLTVPTITIEPPEVWEPLDEALRRVEQYRWVIFTSVNGVTAVRRRLGALGWEAGALASCRIAAIGPATAEVLERWGLRPEVVPDEYVAEGLAARLRLLVTPGDRVLLPRAADSRDVLVRELTALGARVTEVAAYRARPATEGAAELREALARRRVDAVTFTSSSTVRHFAALLGTGELPRLMEGVTVACIGPITRATAAEHGLSTQVMPGDYTIPALARALGAHFERGGPMGLNDGSGTLTEKE